MGKLKKIKGSSNWFTKFPALFPSPSLPPSQSPFKLPLMWTCGVATLLHAVNPLIYLSSLMWLLLVCIEFQKNHILCILNPHSNSFKYCPPLHLISWFHQLIRVMMSFGIWQMASCKTLLELNSTYEALSASVEIHYKMNDTTMSKIWLD